MKKLLILSFCAVILLSVVSGSIAFFTDSVETTNVIASGSIDISQYEYERKKNTDGSYVTEPQDDGSHITVLQEYTQDQTVHPCVQSNPTRGDVLVTDPNGVQQTLNLYVSGMHNFVDKIVSVKNEGDNYAYVRTFIAVPTRSGISWLHLDKNTQNGWVWHEKPDEATGEAPQDTIIRDQVIDGKTYDIYVATNTLPLAPGATAAPSLLGFYLDSRFSNQNGRYHLTDEAGTTHDLGTEPELSILVATEATQAIGYKGDADPLNKVFTDAYDALYTVFGAPGEHHPWVQPDAGAAL